VVVTPDGQVTSRYDKVRRVPFGEYVPLRGFLDALGAPVDEVPTNAIAGTGPAILDLPDGTRLGVVISWEVFFGGRARDGVKHGGEFILNPTNGASYTGTIVQTQQVASSRLRAIETGRWLVQVSPTGFSELVTPDGEVIDRTAVSEQAIVGGTVELRTGYTWYVRAGDAPFIIALLAVFAGAWIATLSRRRRRRPSPFEEDGDGAVIDQRDQHLGAEPARRDGGAEPAEPDHEGDDERLGVFRAGGGDPARAATLRRVTVERELTDDQ
jgi:apolipoprotein N-acyltransferase